MMAGGGSGGNAGGNRSEAVRLIATAEKLIVAGDLHGAKSFAIRVCESDPHLAEPAELILAIADTILAGESRVGCTSMPDWYGVLRLARFTDNHELVATQYSRLGILLNPNRNRFPYADQAFRIVSDAWFVLSDPSRKALYDRELQLSQFLQLGQLGFQLFNQPEQHQHQQAHTQTQTQTQTQTLQNEQLPFQLHSQPPPPPQFQPQPQPPLHHQQQRRLHFDQQPAMHSQMQQQKHQRTHFDNKLLQEQPQPQPQQRLQPSPQYLQVRQEQKKSIRSGSGDSRNHKQPVEEDRLLNLNNATERVQPTRFIDMDPFGRSDEVAQQTLWPPKSTRSLEPMRTSELLRLAEPICPVEPTSEPMQPSKLAVSSEALWPPKSTWLSGTTSLPETTSTCQLRQSSEQIRLSEPTRLSEAVHSPEPMWPPKPTRLSESAQVPEPMPSPESIQPSEPMRPLEPTRLSKQIHTSEPMQPAEHTQAPKPMKSSESTRPVQPSEPAKALDSAQPLQPPAVSQPTLHSQPPPDSHPTSLPEQPRVSRITLSATVSEPKVPSFWTTCPYCFVLYEYPDLYEECVLRCQTSYCRRAFQAVKLPSPPPLTEDDRYYCCWGFFPVGFSKTTKITDGFSPKPAPRNSSPRVYYDDDDVYVEISDPSEEDDDHDWQWNEKKKQKESHAKQSKGKPGRPRKVVQSSSANEASFVGRSGGSTQQLGAPKRRPGRPRKQVQDPLSY